MEEHTDQQVTKEPDTTQQVTDFINIKLVSSVRFWKNC
jgi:hypothetical protein